MKFQGQLILVAIDLTNWHLEDLQHRKILWYFQSLPPPQNQLGRVWSMVLKLHLLPLALPGKHLPVTFCSVEFPCTTE